MQVQSFIRVSFFPMLYAEHRAFSRDQVSDREMRKTGAVFRVLNISSCRICGCREDHTQSVRIFFQSKIPPRHFSQVKLPFSPFLSERTFFLTNNIVRHVTLTRSVENTDNEFFVIFHGASYYLMVCDKQCTSLFHCRADTEPLKLVSF